MMIEAAPEDLWSVSTDAQSCRHWNPFIINAVGAYEEGENITNSVVEAEEKEVTITSKIVTIDPPHNLNQFGGYTGIIAFDHHYELEKVKGGTKLVQREEYTGLCVHFWDASWVEPAYQRVNEVLRTGVLRRKNK